MKQTVIPPETIKSIVEDVFGVNISHRSRKLVYPAARHTFFVMCGLYTNYSLSATGKLVGLDHSTVLYSKKKYVMPEQYISKSRRVAWLLKAIYTEEGGGIIPDKDFLVHHLINKKKLNIELRRENERLKRELLPTEEEQRLIDMFRELSRDRRAQIVNQTNTKLKIQNKYAAA